MGRRADCGGLGTTVQRGGGVGRISREERGNAVRVPLTSSTASAAVRRTTRYHAPRRSCPGSAGRRRAHCPVAIGYDCFRAVRKSTGGSVLESNLPSPLQGPNSVEDCSG